MFKCFHSQALGHLIADCPTCLENKKKKGGGKGKDKGKGGKGSKAKLKAKAVAAATDGDAAASGTQREQVAHESNIELTKASRKKLAAAVSGTGLSVDELAKLVRARPPPK